MKGVSCFVRIFGENKICMRYAQFIEYKEAISDYCKLLSVITL